jgi:imidazolonepropionase-like amidohydrolase
LFARRGEQLGTIEKGKIADLVVVAGNPVADITVMADPSNIRAVIKDGKVVAGSLPD